MVSSLNFIFLDHPIVRVIICLQLGANDLHMVKLMPLPPHHLLLQQNTEWYMFLVPVCPGGLGKKPLNVVLVCVCVCVCVCVPVIFGLS